MAAAKAAAAPVTKTPIGKEKSPAAIAKELRKQLRALKKENAKIQRDFDSQTAEVQGLAKRNAELEHKEKRKANPLQNLALPKRKKVDVLELEDISTALSCRADEDLEKKDGEDPKNSRIIKNVKDVDDMVHQCCKQSLRVASSQVSALEIHYDSRLQM